MVKKKFLIAVIYFIKLLHLKVIYDKISLRVLQFSWYNIIYDWSNKCCSIELEIAANFLNTFQCYAGFRANDPTRAV